MHKDSNISIIQLIKSGEISVNYEINQIKAKGEINVKIRSYLERSNQYHVIQKQISKTMMDLQKAKNKLDRLHLGEKLQSLYQVEKDFVSNVLYLAGTLSKIKPHTDKLKKAIKFFDEGNIREADAVLLEADLLNDQFALIALKAYQKIRINSILANLDEKPY